MSYFRDKFSMIFKVRDTPHRIALAFALGTFVGISPFLGLHYLSGFFLAWLFRLNKLVTLIGVSVNNPWTIVPISSFCAWFGAKLIGMKQVLPEADWKGVTMMKILEWFKSLITDPHNFIDMIVSLLPLIKAFFVGSSVLCTFSAIASYVIIQILVTKYQRI